MKAHREVLDRLYRRYNCQKFVHPDPLQFVYGYNDNRDREVVGLVAACLAYGRVKQILVSVSRALDALGPWPADFVIDVSPSLLRRTFRGFRHRFAAGEHMVALLIGIRSVLREFGSLEACFRSAAGRSDETLLAALCGFADRLKAAGGDSGHLLPDPSKGSACKRLNMYLRWMNRRDDVDPGCWESIGTDKLIVPLDTHMFRIAKTLGATRRGSADMRAALETTAAFGRVRRDDPVRYDFALTRLGIRDDLDLPAFLKRCNERAQSHA